MHPKNVISVTLPITCSSTRYYPYLSYAGWQKLGINLIEVAFRMPASVLFREEKGQPHPEF